MTGRTCMIHGCSQPWAGEYPLCVAHFFNAPAAAREEFFAALDARLGGPAAEDRFKAAWEAVVSLAQPNGRHVLASALK